MQTTNAPTIAEDIERMKTLRRQIGMLRSGHRNLTGIPARQNLVRIEERVAELNSLETLLELSGHYGAEEVAKANALELEEADEPKTEESDCAHVWRRANFFGTHGVKCIDCAAKRYDDFE